MLIDRGGSNKDLALSLIDIGLSKQDGRPFDTHEISHIKRVIKNMLNDPQNQSDRDE